jgi:hypothetical protein
MPVKRFWAKPTTFGAVGGGHFRQISEKKTSASQNLEYLGRLLR